MYFLILISSGLLRNCITFGMESWKRFCFLHVLPFLSIITQLAMSDKHGDIQISTYLINSFYSWHININFYYTACHFLPCWPQFVGTDAKCMSSSWTKFSFVYTERAHELSHIISGSTSGGHLGNNWKVQLCWAFWYYFFTNKHQMLRWGVKKNCGDVFLF